MQGAHVVVTQRVVDVPDLLARGGHDADVAADTPSPPVLHEGSKPQRCSGMALARRTTTADIASAGLP